MASKTLRSNHHYKAFHALGLFVILILVQRAGATEFKVGGATGWTVPTDAKALNQWAEMHRFQIGDSLLFVYQPNKDSVFIVNKDDYENCNVEAPKKKFSDGNTIFKFDQSGSYYFISGVRDNCLKNEKLWVVIMADRSTRSSSSNQTNPASPPSPSAAGSPETTPSMAPVGEEAPSPPPPPPPRNGASSKVTSLMGCFAALLGSPLLFVL
ncbi:early nodulin-like protein 9 [Magnolia sinica]|uniref:early nodulin-like protein 9 n=1 Tax=Magnolia sinica TaxID=86752 RepID=UPI0026590EC7|nr:early nodulin-like protein 9 [Magnolia sinica]